MMTSLVAFAKTGNPQTAAVKWPAWTPDSEQRLVIAGAFSVEPLNVAGLDWLAAHPVRAAAAPAPAPARVSPRD
jgi:carboxylesterase type B